jgi:hypothetical protein
MNDRIMMGRATNHIHSMLLTFFPSWWLMTLTQNKLERLSLALPLHPTLMFASKTKAYPYLHSQTSGKAVNDLSLASVLTLSNICGLAYPSSVPL